MEWIIANKEWLFSGLLVTVPIAFFGWVFAKRYVQRSQSQKAGSNSLNIQVGGNIEIRKDPVDERPKPKSRR